MNWSQVRLIWLREVRDQLRDRRTMFMIFVLPLLLYPLLGTSLLQVAQFVQEKATRVLIVGDFSVASAPHLIENGRFADRLFEVPRDAQLLELTLMPDDSAETARTPEDARAAVERRARSLLAAGEYQAVVYFPPEFVLRMSEFRAALARSNPSEHGPEASPLELPQPEVFHTSAKETSQLTRSRLREVLRAWNAEWGRDNLQSVGVDPLAAAPVRTKYPDTADVEHRDAAVWSKVMPFLLLVWALTGAFYPAVDVCAGEKERGTLETLLCSPAERRDIVWGKLLTVMCFSIATVIFNVLSVTVTGVVALSGLPEIGAPPLRALPWMFLALLPISALFSALCLALAAFARSSKEGQYYLMPLMLVALPLVMLPMAPGVELNLGNSLIPLTGILLLLRQVIEGDGWRALPFVPPIVAVTLTCCVVAVRWAIDQFNSETVLFRESERLDLRLWLRHLVRDRQDLPSAAAAVFCGVLILSIKYFLSLFANVQPGSFRNLASNILILQLVAIVTPAAIMAVMLTRRPALSLRLRLPNLAGLGAGAALAVALHPVVIALHGLVMRLYPLNSQVAEQLKGLTSGTDNFLLLIALLALVPALCEELAFRGFILSGLQQGGRPWRAIFVSALLFALTHSVLQQTLLAFPVGIVIGYVAIQTRSLLPGILFHLLHNALALGMSKLDPRTIADSQWAATVFRVDGTDLSYSAWVVGLGAFFAAWLLFKLPDLSAFDSGPIRPRGADDPEHRFAAG